MTGTLQYKLPDETDEFKQALFATDLVLAVEEYLNWLRSEIKYQCEKYDDGQVEVMETARNKLYLMLEERGVGSLVA